MSAPIPFVFPKHRLPECRHGLQSQVKKLYRVKGPPDEHKNKYPNKMI